MKRFNYIMYVHIILYVSVTVQQFACSFVVIAAQKFSDLLYSYALNLDVYFR